MKDALKIKETFVMYLNPNRISILLNYRLSQIIGEVQSEL